MTTYNIYNDGNKARIGSTEQELLTKILSVLLNTGGGSGGGVAGSFVASITALTGNTASSLDGIATASGATPFGTVVPVVLNNVRQNWWIFVSGAFPGLGGQVQPADQVGPNLGYWQEIE